MNKILKYEQAMKLSLENAERFIEDAKILIQNSSFGHALALSIFGDEEIAKSYVCWFVVNKLMPASSIVAKEIFRDHYAKHENQIWLHIVALLAEQASSGEIKLEQIIKEGLMVRKDQLEKDLEKLNRLSIDREELRKRGIYVDIRKNKVLSPRLIQREEAEEVLGGVKYRLEYIRKFMKDFAEPKKFALLKQLFDSLPNEVKETGRFIL